MSDGGARVESIDLLKALKRAMIKFAEAANVALSDAESEGTRTLLWLQNEQLQFWNGQIRKRTEIVGRCEEALRMKKLFVDSAGRRSSAIDEIKALQKAKHMLEEAQQKYTNCKMWSRRLEKEMQTYRGNVQRFATTIQAALPVQTARLETSVRTLERYLNINVPGQAASSAAGSSAPTSLESAGAGTMVRPADEPEVRNAGPAEVEQPQQSPAESDPVGESSETST